MNFIVIADFQVHAFGLIHICHSRYKMISAHHRFFGIIIIIIPVLAVIAEIHLSAHIRAVCQLALVKQQYTIQISNSLIESRLFPQRPEFVFRQVIKPFPLRSIVAVSTVYIIIGKILKDRRPPCTRNFAERAW